MGGLKTAGVRLIAENEAAFVRALNNARAEEMKLTTATQQMVPAMASTGSASDLMRGKIDALTIKLDFQRRQLEILKSQLSETVAKYGEGSIQADRQRLSLDKLNTSIAQGEGKLKEYQAAQASGAQGATALTGVVRGLGTAMAGLGLAVSGAMIIQKLFEVMKMGIDEAAKEEVLITRMGAVIHSMGRESEFTVVGLDAMSMAMMRQSAIDDDLIKELEGTLLVYENISTDVMPRAVKAALDLSAAWGMDLNTAGMRIGKMMEFPTRNLNVLSRQGIQFTAQQKDMIKALEDSGDLLGAQGIILDELGKKFGGQALANSRTFTGQLNLLKSELLELMELGGGKFLPSLTKLLSLDAKGIGVLTDTLKNYKGELLTLPGLVQQFRNTLATQTAAEAESNKQRIGSINAIERGNLAITAGIPLNQEQIQQALDYEKALLGQNVALAEVKNAQQAYTEGQAAWTQVGMDAAQGLDKYMREGSDKWRAAQGMLDEQLGTSVVAQYDYTKALDTAAKGYDSGKLSLEQYGEAVTAAGEKKGLTPLDQLKSDAIAATTKLDDARNKLLSFPKNVTSHLTIIVTYRGGGKGPPTTATQAGDTGGLQEFQHGGRARVTGTGGPDSRLVQMMMTPGEVLTVTPPGESIPYGGPATMVNIGEIVQQSSLDTDILIAALERI